jgi:type II secretory pathway pseudopilin PulG
MIVILLIGVIGGVLSHSLRGTLDRGKEFRSKEGAKRLADILNMQIELELTKIETLFTGNTTTASSIDTGVKDCVRDSKFIPADELETFLLDGWKQPYIIKKDKQNVIVSRKPVDAEQPQSATPDPPPTTP